MLTQQAFAGWTEQLDGDKKVKKKSTLRSSSTPHAYTQLPTTPAWREKK
jgi:hypothetical protein